MIALLSVLLGSFCQICFGIVLKPFHINANVTFSNVKAINIHKAGRLVLKLDLELKISVMTQKKNVS